MHTIIQALGKLRQKDSELEDSQPHRVLSHPGLQNESLCQKKKKSPSMLTIKSSVLGVVQGPCEKIHRLKEDDLFCIMLSLKQHMSYGRWPTAI